MACPGPIPTWPLDKTCEPHSLPVSQATYLVFNSTLISEMPQHLFSPSCASVALARSSHIVVLMNELYRCSCYVPHWGVKSGVRTITQSKVGSGPKENKSKQQQSKNHTKTQKTKTSQKQNRKESPDQTSPMGWQMMPLNYEILHGNKTQTTRSQSKIMRRCPAKQSTQQRRNPGSPLPGSGDRAEKPSRHKTSSQ